MELGTDVCNLGRVSGSSAGIASCSPDLETKCSMHRSGKSVEFGSGLESSKPLMTDRPAPNGRRLWLRAALSMLIMAAVNTRAADPAPLRAGMIGLDTSHVPAFAKLFNSPNAAGDLTGIRIV